MFALAEYKANTMPIARIEVFHLLSSPENRQTSLLAYCPQTSVNIYCERLIKHYIQRGYVMQYQAFWCHILSKYFYQYSSACISAGHPSIQPQLLILFCYNGIFFDSLMQNLIILIFVLIILIDRPSFMHDFHIFQQISHKQYAFIQKRNTIDLGCSKKVSPSRL